MSEHDALTRMDVLLASMVWQMELLQASIANLETGEAGEGAAMAFARFMEITMDRMAEVMSEVAA